VVLMPVGSGDLFGLFCPIVDKHPFWVDLFDDGVCLIYGGGFFSVKMLGKSSAG